MAVKDRWQKQTSSEVASKGYVHVRRPDGKINRTAQRKGTFLDQVDYLVGRR